MTTTIEISVHIDCPGCESKVRNALQKLKGVDNVDIDMAMQKVTITGWADQKKVLRIVRKTGRRAELWQQPPFDSEYNFDTDQYYSQQQCNGSAPQPSSSYNYYKHGYDGPSNYHAYYSQNSANSSSYGYQTTAAFSDENPHACSMM
ncbi:heavy metal-associated isoprenylated plant protein 28-like [Malus domestica]|uniref:heavy metal-associated isoprenylated plant protein 28-like n=1 Tax=Malus domestica TaxID=3750 RepID=UPI000498A109|nr:heavy metal-associated isoprenylated plant protein 28-like [Malus domestica]